MPSQTRSPGTIVNDTSYGQLLWSAPGNAAASDNVYASVFNSGEDRNTYYLKATNFEFSIPAGMTITGIKVEIERRGTPTGAEDARVRLVKGGVVQSHDKASSGFWPTIDEYAPYGGDGDLWGDSWGPQHINDSGFGVVLSARVFSNEAAYVDHIQVTVYYTESSQHVAAQCV